MTPRPKKRKTRPFELSGNIERHEPDPSLFIQAYEADLVRGPSAKSAARSLEVTKGKSAQVVGDALIQWKADGRPRDNSPSAEDHASIGSHARNDDSLHDEGGVWVDRYAPC